MPCHGRAALALLLIGLGWLTLACSPVTPTPGPSAGPGPTPTPWLIVQEAPGGNGHPTLADFWEGHADLVIIHGQTILYTALERDKRSRLALVWKR